MNRQNPNTRRMAVAAMIAAAYCAVSLLLLPFSFGPIQVRVSEALTLLTVFSPAAIWGVTLGCVLTNAIGAAMGTVLPTDILIGSAATLLSALMSYRLRKVRFHGLPVAASIPPVLINAVVIGAELTLMFGPVQPKFFIYHILTVGLGQIAACCVLGLPLVWALERVNLDRKLFGSL